MERSPELLESVLKEHPEWKSSRIAEYTGYSRRQVRRKRKELYDAISFSGHQPVEDTLSDPPVESGVSIATEDVYLENAKLRKETQALRDKLRILRRDDRTTHRYMNASEELTKELIAALDKRASIVGQYIKEHEIVNDECTGILQLSDLHLNELIDISSNRFDFVVASKRLKKFIYRAKFIFKLYGVETVVIAMCGDIVNSDRRLDECLNFATNRSRACMLAVHLLSQVILDLNKIFNIEVVSVSGNESRIQEHVAYSDILISDNYDSTIYEILKREFRQSSGGVKFLQSNHVEQIVKIQNHNILLLHGDQITSGDSGLEKKVQQIKGKYDIPISYVIFGHLHSCRIGEMYSRSSSLCGSNAYSSFGLQLLSRASQNIHMITKSSIDSLKVDLQNADEEGWSGYDIEKELEYYNAKSATKVNWMRGKTI